jgi:hypothetical protein
MTEFVQSSYGWVVAAEARKQASKQEVRGVQKSGIGSVWLSEIFIVPVL